MTNEICRQELQNTSDAACEYKTNQNKINISIGVAAKAILDIRKTLERAASIIVMLISQPALCSSYHL